LNVIYLVYAGDNLLGVNINTISWCDAQLKHRETLPLP